MTSMMRWARRLIPRAASPPKQFAYPRFHSIDVARKIEEEKFPFYEAAHYYPVRIGEVFNSKYQVIGKLGYGAYSTVWLCRDLPSCRYVALKVYTGTKQSGTSQENREVEMYKYLSNLKTDHPGRAQVRTNMDSFEVTGPNNSHHHCLVHRPMSMSIGDLQPLCPAGRFSEYLLKYFLMHILWALDFLHTGANVIHTDIKATNLLLEINDESILEDFEKAELEDPSPRKVDGDRIIYESRAFRLTDMLGRPVLCDLGEARMGAEHHDDIQPFMYRAPEVLLQMPWGNKIWDLFEGKHMFEALDTEKKPSNPHHLAEMIALLGPPPPEFILRAPQNSYGRLFDDEGNWNQPLPIPTNTLESSEENLEGQDKALFLNFMRKMLCWVPEERKTAMDLLEDPWLKKGLVE
ncbi:MAG: hypothetical protein M1819_004332 [Sarea resinae]|nr:MAG: hypothetical protein M1819_004332 [Sarea resinae]